MGQIEKLLKYQEADEKLLKIERETSGSEERKNFAQAKNFLTKAPEKLDSLEAKALELKRLRNSWFRNMKKSPKSFRIMKISTNSWTAAQTFLSIKRAFCSLPKLLKS